MAPARPTAGAAAVWPVAACALAAAISFLLLLHNFALPLWPEQHLVIPRAAIAPAPQFGPSAYAFAFDGSDPDRPQNPRSRVRLTDNGISLGVKLVAGAQFRSIADGWWMHAPGFVIFSATDNSDPRVNGHVYALSYPPWYSLELGLLAGGVFVVAVAGLYWLSRQAPVPAPGDRTAAPSWFWHVAGSGLLFLAGLYCNTGTLAPYANTAARFLVAPDTGYLYSVDHHHFRALFDFVNGAERATWEHALMLRRILYSVLAWPFTRLGGFEVGGVVAGLIFNGAGFLAGVWLLRHRLGTRAAIFAAWLLALYPGAAYWVGMPYAYTLIFPCSLLCMLGLMALADAPPPKRLVVICFAMGFAYLAYDLALFFLPATLFLLAWRRRWTAATAACATQMLPTMLWLAVLRFGFGIPLVNANTSSMGAAAGAYLHPGDLGLWWVQASGIAGTGWDTFFGANFLFLPALCLLIVALNPSTARIRPSLAEAALALAVVGVFLFMNLAPAYAGAWQLRGSWIARLFQPVFPAFIVFAARWWRNLPPLGAGRRALVWAAVIGAAAGNALVVFGPILADPGHISREAFYRFYTHNDKLLATPYDDILRTWGRRPLGFPAPLPESSRPAGLLPQDWTRARPRRRRPRRD